MSNNNQYHFEVIRDLIPMIGNLRPGETIAIAVTRHEQNNLLDWNTSKGNRYGSSHISAALEKTYREMLPDVRFELDDK